MAMQLHIHPILLTQQLHVVLDFMKGSAILCSAGKWPRKKLGF